jgi:exodeoxyribonuclease VII large subunit
MQPSLSLPAGVQVLTVGQLTQRIKRALEEKFPTVWVEGEISNFHRHAASGHCYLKLKDSEATLSTTIWRTTAQRLKFEPSDGLRVIVRGRMNLYPPRGEYSLVVDEIQPKGIGPLELAYRQLREKLERLGYFDLARKKPIPPLPRRVALITSATSSAVRDMLETLGRRWPAVEVWVRHTRVQGDGAALEIEEALAFINLVGGPDSTTPVDVVILGRGGGSLEDLWPFNEEPVARGIAASVIPIVTGIGHEDDYTLADMVADLRALTPTDAATKIVPDRAVLLRQLRTQSDRLRDGLLRRLETASRQLRDLAQRRCFRQPLDRLRDEERRLDDLGERLVRAARQQIDRSLRRLDAAAAQLESLSPLKVLARGYSLTRRQADNAVVRAAEQVQPGDRIVTLLERGSIVSRVEKVEPPS